MVMAVAVSVAGVAAARAHPDATREREGGRLQVVLLADHESLRHGTFRLSFDPLGRA
jgi:hypothetical protein